MVREARLSERALEAGHPPGIDGMLAVLETMKVTNHQPKSPLEKEIDAIEDEEDPTRPALIADLMLVMLRADDVHSVERLLRKYGDHYSTINMPGGSTHLRSCALRPTGHPKSPDLTRS